MKKILITRKLIKDSEDKASKTFEPIFNSNDELYSQSKVIEMSKGCDGILTNSSTKAITIQSKAVTPTDIFIKGGSDQPGCPGGRSTTEFDSDPGSGNSVTWEIDYDKFKKRCRCSGLGNRHCATLPWI